MSKNDIEVLLEDYTSRTMQLEALRVKKQELIDGVITPEIKEKLADIDAEFDPVFENARARLDDVERTIKSAVADLGKTVKNDVFMAVYSKPRVSWDSRFLEGLIAVYPEVKNAKKVGKPSVSIRRVK